MKIGAESKKIGILAGLLLVGAYLFYTNVVSPPSGGPAPESRPAVATRGAAPATTPSAAPAPASPRRSQPQVRTSSEEFRPSLKPRRPEDRQDPMSIDPTLRLDLLAKVQAVEPQGGSRNLFQFSAPPVAALPKGPEPKIVPKTPAQMAKEKAEEQKKIAEAGPPKPPPPPPINLKYFGYSTIRGENRKKAFFLDGEDILVAAEGDLVKRRYKVVRIGVNSVVMEDVESKNQQTLPLQEEAAG